MFQAALPPYAMKPIKPSTESGRPKRRSAPRKSAQDPPGSPITKRKRQAQPKSQVPPPKIACFACGQANVPLIMGGSKRRISSYLVVRLITYPGYCRPCVEGGRVGETSQASEATVSSKLPTHDSVQPLPKPVDPPPQSLTSQPDKV